MRVEPKRCTHFYQPVMMIQAGTGTVFGQGGHQMGRYTAQARDVWVYECLHCGHRFQTDDTDYNKDAQL